MPNYSDASRSALLRAIAEDVESLTAKVESSALYERAPGKGLDGISRRNPERQVHRLTAPGLIHQLVAALIPGSPMENEGIGRSTPGSSSPSSSRVSDTLAVIDRKAARIVADMRRTGRLPAVSRARRTLVGDVLAIRTGAHATSETRDVETIAVELGRWVAKARLALTYDAESYVLPKRCPGCGGELRVRPGSDSPIRCTGYPADNDLPRRDPCVDERGKPRSWPKSSWVFLLEQL